MLRKRNRVVYRFWHNQSAQGRIGYIGKDVRHPRRFNLKNRIKEKECKKLYRALKRYPFKFWRKEVLAFGFRTDAALSKAEIFYIKKFDSKNKGYNCTDGGEGMSGYVPSVSTKAKIGAAHRGKTISVEQRAQLRKANKGKKQSAATIAKRVKVLTGQKRSDATRAKMRTRRGENHHCWGKRLSAKHKAKISASHKGKKNHFYGKKHSVETRKKMSACKKGKRNPWWKKELSIAHIRWHVKRNRPNLSCKFCAV